MFVSAVLDADVGTKPNHSGHLRVQPRHTVLRHQGPHLHPLGPENQECKVRGRGRLFLRRQLWGGARKAQKTHQT